MSNKFLEDDTAGETVDLAPIYASLDTKLLKTGDTMTGTLTMGANKVTSSYTAIDPTDLVNKDYVTNNTITNPLTSGDLTVSSGSLIISNATLKPKTILALTSNSKRLIIY